MTGNLTRRNFVKTAGVALATATGCTTSQTDEPPAQRVKGPLVYLDYDQAALDAAYDQRVWAPNMQQVLARLGASSETARSRLGEPERLAYGPTAIESLDVYRTDHANAPIHIYIHGGAWRSGQARTNAFPAEMFVSAGAHYVVPDYVKVQEAGRSLFPLADHVRRVIAWVYRNASTIGGDPGRIYVSGSSAGAHLAGVVLVTDWPKDFDLPEDTVKGGLLSSGMYDLYPVSLSARREYVAFDDAMVEALSPLRHLDKLTAPVVVAYGTAESPEFKRQSREFADALVKAGKEVQLLVGEDYNHFEIVETLANPFGLLGHAALAQMGLTWP